MSITVDSPAHPGATAGRSRFARLLQPVERLIARCGDYRRARRDTMVLLGLDDHMLADIGLHRSILLAGRGALLRHRRAWTQA